jgi:predicted nucleic acid-binding protein
VTHGRPPARKLMIMDACVLIDFIKAQRTVLELVVRHVGPLHVTSPVVDEVNEIDNESELVELGLLIVEPELEDAFMAASQYGGPTSFQDRLCLLAAKRHGFTCVTNDKNLRKLCKQEGVPILWGLELLAELHKAGGVSGREAERIAQTIRASNPKHITAKIVSRFVEIIRQQETQRSRP